MKVINVVKKTSLEPAIAAMHGPHSLYFNLIVSCIEIMNNAKVRVEDSKVRRFLSPN